jgi:hypothetical protein
LHPNYKPRGRTEVLEMKEILERAVKKDSSSHDDEEAIETL